MRSAQISCVGIGSHLQRRVNKLRCQSAIGDMFERRQDEGVAPTGAGVNASTREGLLRYVNETRRVWAVFKAAGVGFRKAYPGSKDRSHHRFIPLPTTTTTAITTTTSSSMATQTRCCCPSFPLRTGVCSTTRILLAMLTADVAVLSRSASALAGVGSVRERTPYRTFVWGWSKIIAAAVGHTAQNGLLTRASSPERGRRQDLLEYPREFRSAEVNRDRGKAPTGWGLACDRPWDMAYICWLVHGEGAGAAA